MAIKYKIMICFFAFCSLEINQAGADDNNHQTLEEAHVLKEKNKTILVEFIEEIWNKGNLDAADKFISTPYTIYHDPGDPWEGQSLDLATFKKRVMASRLIFPDLHFILKDVVAEGDKVAISWIFQGTQKADLPGLPATGKSVAVSGLTIYSFSNGKITGHWQVIDRLGQVGIKEKQK